MWPVTLTRFTGRLDHVRIAFFLRLIQAQSGRVARHEPRIARRVVRQRRRRTTIGRRRVNRFTGRQHLRDGRRRAEILGALLSKFDLFNGGDDRFAEVEVSIFLENEPKSKERPETGRTYLFDVRARFRVTLSDVLVECLTFTWPE